MRKRADGDERQDGYSGQRGSGLTPEQGPGFSDQLIKGVLDILGDPRQWSFHGKVSQGKGKVSRVEKHMNRFESKWGMPRNLMPNRL